MGKNNKVKHSRNTVLIAAIVFNIGACGTTGSVDSPSSQINTKHNESSHTAFSSEGDADNDGISDVNDNCANTRAGVGVDLKGCALDTDGDSVADYLDHCRGTPKGVKVDGRGCGYDDDGDGVANFRDKCSDTIKDVSVDGDGCEWDSDNDGVVDSKDKCAGTPPSVVVESMGCHILEIVTLSGVHFKTGSDELSQSAKDILNKLAITLKKHPRMRVEIGGHTDDTGSRLINEQLSLKRAKSALTYLVDHGVKQSVLTSKGYSFLQPVANNETAQGRSLNRRVEMRIVEID